MQIDIRFLSRAQVEALAPNPTELVEVISAGLAAHGRGNVVMPPKAHLHLDHLFAGHFNILSGYVGPIGRAGGGRRSAAWPGTF
jgi:alanine dehydrogenase